MRDFAIGLLVGCTVIVLLMLAGAVVLLLMQERGGIGIYTA